MDNYGLVGRKLGHSFSQKFFEDFFKEKGIAALYSNFEIPDITQIEAVFQHENLRGLNVTVPYKELVIPFLDELSPEAMAIGAVNVIAFRNGKKIGHNSDAFGFHQSIKPFLTNLHERALILGTGGSSKAVAHVFRTIGLDVIFASRNPEGEFEFPYSTINEHMLRACKVVVNTTPLGMYPDVQSSVPFPFDKLTTDHLVIDLVYNPDKTKFLQQAEANGATILNGKSMLHEQALRSWDIWHTP